MAYGNGGYDQAQNDPRAMMGGTGGLSAQSPRIPRASGCTRCSNGSSCKQNGPTLGGTSAHNSNRARIQERDYQWTA